MSGLTCKSLGLSASFAKSLINHIMSQTIEEGDGTVNMKDYMAKIRKGEEFVNPEVMKQEKYVPVKPAPVEANPLNADRQRMQWALDNVANKEFEEKGTRPVVVNVEASIPNKELMKFFPKIKEKFKNYRWYDLMERNSTTIVTTMDVDKNNKPIMQPVTTHGGEPVVDRKTGKPIMVPKTDLRIVTYDPMGMGGGPDSTVAEMSLATDEIIIGAIKEEASITAEECVSRQKTTADAIRAKQTQALAGAGGKIDSFNFSTKVTRDDANDEITITLDITSTATADWDKLTH